MPSRAARTIFFVFAVLLIWVNSTAPGLTFYRCFFIHSFHIPIDEHTLPGDLARLPARQLRDGLGAATMPAYGLQNSTEGLVQQLAAGRI